MNNDLKQKLQEREFAVLKDRQRVILKWATGCGKSKMTIDLINNAVKGYLPGHPAKILFVVAERAHIQNWQDEMFKWKLNLSKVNTTVICYASLHKVKDMTFDAIVFDEAHHAFTDKRLAIIETLHSKYVFMLSATLPSCNTEVMEEIFGEFTTSTITLKDAIESDILPDPRVYVISIELDDSIADQTIRSGGECVDPPVVDWKHRARYIYSNAPCIIKCTQKQKYQYFTENVDYWKDRYMHSHNTYHNNKWVNYGSRRKTYIGNLKTKYVKDLIRQISAKKRFVCFCASVAQALELSVGNTISSKKPAKKNQEVIDAFNARDINQIFAVGMITEGMNLTDIQAGIITQLDGKERLFIQKAGRVLRADDPIAFIFYYKGTQDEVYLKKALENIDSKYIQYLNINQLNTIRL